MAHSSQHEQHIRRLKRLVIDGRLLVALLSQDGKKTFSLNGMPSDARIVGCTPGCDMGANNVTLLIWSASFEPTPYGSFFPTMTVDVTEAPALSRAYTVVAKSMPVVSLPEGTHITFFGMGYTGNAIDTKLAKAVDEGKFDALGAKADADFEAGRCTEAPGAAQVTPAKINFREFL